MNSIPDKKIERHRFALKILHVMRFYLLFLSDLSFETGAFVKHVCVLYWIDQWVCQMVYRDHKQLCCDEAVRAAGG